MPRHIVLFWCIILKMSEELGILKDIRDTLKKIFEIINKKPSKIERVFSATLTVIGILGILTIIDVVFSWFNK